MVVRFLPILLAPNLSGYIRFRIIVGTRDDEMFELIALLHISHMNKISGY